MENQIDVGSGKRFFRCLLNAAEVARLQNEAAGITFGRQHRPGVVLPGQVGKTFAACQRNDLVVRKAISSGTPARARRTGWLASDRVTATWQLSCLPIWPRYWRATPTECVPFLGMSVSEFQPKVAGRRDPGICWPRGGRRSPSSILVERGLQFATAGRNRRLSGES